MEPSNSAPPILDAPRTAPPESQRRLYGWPAHPGAFAVPKDELQETFERTVDEGERRTQRSWPSLLSTGFVGGLDVGIGVFALLIVLEATGSELLAAMAFSIGFIALILAKSELFTENFLVPIAAAVSRHARPRAVVRLWGGTLVSNLLGGLVVMTLVVAAFPRLGDDAVNIGRIYPEWGIGWSSFSGAVLAGMVITLMTWMERGSVSPVGKLAAAVGAAWVLAAAPLNHTVVISHEMFAALEFGAPFGVADAAGAVGWAAFGNMVGGIGLVTLLRLIQVGRQAVEVERARPEGVPRDDNSGPQLVVDGRSPTSGETPAVPPSERGE